MKTTTKEYKEILAEAKRLGFTQEATVANGALLRFVHDITGKAVELPMGNLTHTFQTVRRRLVEAAEIDGTKKWAIDKLIDKIRDNGGRVELVANGAAMDVTTPRGDGDTEALAKLLRRREPEALEYLQRDAALDRHFAAMPPTPYSVMSLELVHQLTQAVTKIAGNFAESAREQFIKDAGRAAEERALKAEQLAKQHEADYLDAIAKLDVVEKELAELKQQRETMRNWLGAAGG